MISLLLPRFCWRPCYRWDRSAITARANCRSTNYLFPWLTAWDSWIFIFIICMKGTSERCRNSPTDFILSSLTSWELWWWSAATGASWNRLWYLFWGISICLSRLGLWHMWLLFQPWGKLTHRWLVPKRYAGRNKAAWVTKTRILGRTGALSRWKIIISRRLLSWRCYPWFVWKRRYVKLCKRSSSWRWLRFIWLGSRFLRLHQVTFTLLSGSKMFTLIGNVHLALVHFFQGRL